MEESVKEIQNFEDAVVLKTCKQCLQRKDKMPSCSKCKYTYYCDQECQRKNWEAHKNTCGYIFNNLEYIDKIFEWFNGSKNSVYTKTAWLN